MRKTMTVALASLLAATGLTTAANANCASAGEIAALKTAALQQALMVAAFNCHAIRQYNRFVLDHRAELVESDARLKAYFVHDHGGEAGYHTYKTELANASSLRSIRDTDAFCARADDAFEMAAGPTLSAVLEAWPGTSYPICARGATEVAAASPAPRIGIETVAPAPHRRLDAP